MIARCRERGLGTMTWEIARHLRPAKTLVVAKDEVDFVDEERFPGARWAKLNELGQLPDDDIDWLLSDVDVLYTAETPYDFRILDEARRRGVGTALHGMFEYLPYRARADLPRPDLFLAPSLWCLDRWPQPCRYLPVPVAADRFERRRVDHVETILHPAGAPARGDRNGTLALLQALPFVRSPVRIVIRSQGSLGRQFTRFRSRAKVVVEPPAEDYWRVFDGADAVVLPRRYGGLSLPIQEASALGLPILALSREQETGYRHTAVVQTKVQRPLGLPCGPVRRAEVNPRLLATAIDRLVAEPEVAQQMSDASDRWAQGHTWEALGGLWGDVLASVAR